MSRFWPLLISATSFFLALAIGGALINLAERRRRDEQRQTVKDIGIAQAHILEDHLNQALSATFALASVLRQRGGIHNFDALAAEMIKNYRGISSLQLAPKGVVTQVYPLAGNEAAIGHDLLNDPQRRTEALSAIESQKLTLAGPLTLVQGGMAVIGRLPVFVPDKAGGERFWGFTIALVRLPGLLKASNLNRLVEQGYSYNISRVYPDGGAEFVFAWSNEGILKSAISSPVEVPNGRWILAIAPRGGWQPSASLPWEIGLALLVSALVSVVTYSFTRRRDILYEEVEFRTRELSEANRELEAQILQRKQTEEALKGSEERLRLLLETTNVIPWEADAKTWQFTYVGPQATKLLGYPLEQWAKKDFWASHILPEDRESAIRTCLESSEECKEFDFEYRMVSSEGQTVWVHDIVSVEAVDGAPKTLRGFMVDITERKRAEESLRENEERTRLIVESALDAVVTMDTRGLITGWNPQAETIFGSPREEIVGRRMDETIIPLRYREAHRRGLEHFLASNNGPMLNKRTEFAALHRDGHEFPVELTVVPTRTGETVSFNAFVRDITERKRAERELRERLQFEELVSTISARFANVPANELDGALSDGLRRLGEFFDVDRCAVIEFSEDGKSSYSSYRWFSDRVDQATNVPRQILFSTVGERWRRGEIVVFGRQEEIPENQREIRQAAEQAGFKSHLSVPLNVGGEFIGAVGITSVMCEREWSGEVIQRFKVIGELFANAMTRKRAEEALQHLSGRLINSQEEAHRRLARELHDDVSQRLAVLSIEAGKLEQLSHYTPELIRGKLQGMKDHIVKLAGDIHRISRQLHPSILDDLGLVDAMESECRRFSELEGIPVKFTAHRFPEGTPMDVSLCLYRVTQESLRNIAKHSKATGAHVTLTGKNGGVFLSVEDAGVGFDPVKTQGKLGLGLASMKERVKLIKGKLTVHSAPGKGTVIEIQAPLASTDRV